MTQQAKQLLQKIYNFQSNTAEPFRVSEEEVSKYDVAFLENSGYITQPFSTVGAYHLSLTVKGFDYVRNGFVEQKQPTQNIFNFGPNTSFQNSTVGTDIHGVSYSFHAGASISELKELIRQKPAVDQEQLNELIAILERIKESNQPVNKNILVRFPDLLQKYSDLIVPLGKVLIGIFTGVQ